MSSNSGMNADQLKQLIREVPDFPKKGILFYDITTLLKNLSMSAAKPTLSFSRVVMS